MMAARKEVAISMLYVASLMVVSRGWISSARRVIAKLTGTNAASSTPGASGASGFSGGSVGGGIGGGTSGSW